MYLLQWTWGIVQNLIGFLLMLFIRNKTLHHFYGTVIVEYHASKLLKNASAFALGMFIFCKDTDEEMKRYLLTHEYGHTIQSILYGPLFLPIVGICSVRWSLVYSKNREILNASKIFYAHKYPERQANYWGERFLGHQGIYW